MQWWHYGLCVLGLVLGWMVAGLLVRYWVRWRSVTRVRSELRWFYQRRNPRLRFTPGSGRHAATTPIVVLRRFDGSTLGRVPNTSSTPRH